ncbi:DUF4270 domain-containing protein [Lutimonas sp.]|uniref:DUF4270 domain-containing protein n=1 Tax=Lutimonas sp. TaxID=1872403 RepID=UPI003D9BC0AC
MSSKKFAIFRNIGVGIIFLLGIVSCEKDLEDIGVDLTGQRPFNVGDTILEVIAYHRNVDSSRVDNNDLERIPLSLLGVNTNGTFGSLKSDMVSQVYLPTFGADFGQNAIIDRVVLNIPYFSTRDGDQDAVDPISGLPIEDEDGDTIQVPNFILDSVYGNQDLEFKVSVFELGTFLNSLDPNDPTQAIQYFSDKEYVKNDLLHEDAFKPNRNDTVLYVERRYLDDDPNTVDDIDTIIAPTSAPSMKFDLDKQFFKDRFVDHDNFFDFEDNAAFVQYFRGLYVDAEGFDGSLINVPASNATMTIYYTNEELRNEGEDEDLNNNGIEGETDVYVKTKQAQIYPFGGVRTGYYERSYAGSKAEEVLMNPDTERGEINLYVQGAAGSEVIIELFDEETLAFLRSQNLLINEANLMFYVDGVQDEVPNKMYLYKYDFNSMISDLYNFRFGPVIFGGELEYDEEGNPDYYKFRITDYMTNMIKGEEPVALSRLALKNDVETDGLNTGVLDTIVQQWNYIPKGVVLHGNRPADNNKRIKLEIFYSD